MALAVGDARGACSAPTDKAAGTALGWLRRDGDARMPVSDAPAVASVAPSGESATAVTESVWPSSVRENAQKRRSD